MSYNFNTIDGLFRPNYKVYDYIPETSEKEYSSAEPTLATYKPQNIHRVKSVVKEIPSQNDPTDTPESPTPAQYEVEFQFENSQPQQDYEYFISELNKFITNNPQYENIKDSLARLAALESSYKMGVTNYSGSNALGWFQFMDNTRKEYNTQTREQFARDPQAQLLAAAQHYTKLQQEISKRGGDSKDFVTMYGAWWRPESAYAYLKNPNYDFKTKYGESFQQIIQRARNFVNRDGKDIS